MSLFSYPISVIRTAGGLDENGTWQEAFSQNDTIYGTVQPVTDQEYLNLPEGRKQFGAVKIYTNAELKICDATNASAGDIVIHGGQKWEIAQRMLYSNGLIPHTKYIAYLVVEVPNA